MSVLNLTDEEKAEIRKKHQEAVKRDRDNKSAMMGGPKVKDEKKEDKKKES